MRRAPVALLFALLAALSIVVPASTFGTPEIGQKDNGWSKTEERYLHVYVDCWHSFHEKCGRNIVDDGLDSGKAPSQGRVESSTATMERWLNPKPEPTVASSISSDVAPPAPATTSVAPTSAGGCPSYMAAEASSPDAVNPTSGAAGCFQIIPSTQAAYGCGAPDAACAAAICADVGATAWQASGADPCPYVQP